MLPSCYMVIMTCCLFLGSEINVSFLSPLPKNKNSPPWLVIPYRRLLSFDYDK